MQAIFFIAGAVCFLAALADAKWFFTSRNVAYLKKYFNRKGIRIIYAIIGVVLMGLALFFYYNLQQISFEKIR